MYLRDDIQECICLYINIYMRVIIIEKEVMKLKESGEKYGRRKGILQLNYNFKIKERRRENIFKLSFFENV